MQSQGPPPDSSPTSTISHQRLTIAKPRKREHGDPRGKRFLRVWVMLVEFNIQTTVYVHHYVIKDERVERDGKVISRPLAALDIQKIAAYGVARGNCPLSQRGLQQIHSHAQQSGAILQTVRVFDEAAWGINATQQ